MNKTPKQANLWTLALKGIKKHPLRSTLSIVAIALGVSILLGTEVALPTLNQQAHNSQIARVGNSTMDVIASNSVGFNTQIVKNIESVGGVSLVQALYQKPVAARADKNSITPATLTLAAVSNGQIALRPVNLSQGRFPAEDSTSEVVLTEDAASALQATGTTHPVQLGDKIYLTTAQGIDSFVVVGLTKATTGSGAFVHYDVLVSGKLAATDFALGLHTPLVALHVNDPSKVQFVLQALRQHLSTSTITLNNPDSSGNLSGLEPLLVLLSLLGIALGAGVAANCIALSVASRRREIGLMRVAGASPRQVFWVFTAEGEYLAFLGSVLGILGGWGLAFGLVNLLKAKDLPTPDLVVTPLIVALCMAMGIVITLIGTSIPALKAASLTPLTAIRPQPYESSKSKSILLLPVGLALLLVALYGFYSLDSSFTIVGLAAFLASLIFLGPVLFPVFIKIWSYVLWSFMPSAPLAAQNLNRSKNRTTKAAAGLTISLAVAIGSSILTSSAVNAGDAWVNQLFNGNVVISSPVTQSEDLLNNLTANELSHSSGVDHVTALRFLAAPVEGHVVGITVADYSEYIRNNTFNYVQGTPSSLEDLANSNNVVVPLSLASEYKWNVGSQIAVDNGQGGVKFTVVAVIQHSFPTSDGRDSLLMSKSVAQNTFGKTALGFDSLELTAPNANAATFSDRAASYGMQANDVSAIRSSAENALSNSLGLVTALSWLIVIISLVAVVNTLAMQIQGRSRDMGLLRAIGLSSPKAFGILVNEALLIALSSLTVGIAAGCAIALPLLKVNSTTAFDLPFTFPWALAVGIVLTVLLGVLIAAIKPAFQAASKSIINNLRYEG